MERPIVLQRAIVGLSEKDLHLLLMVAAYEARQCPKESPDQIARTLIETSIEK